MQIRTIALLAGAFAAMTLSTAAQAADDYAGFQAGDIMLRGRVLAVMPTVTSKVSVIGGQVDASQSVVPELDVSYFFTKNISAELIAAISRHHLRDEGPNVDLGRVTLLPPTLTAQYHFLPTAPVNPYLGAGVNYTMFFDHELPKGGAATSIHYDNTFAPAIQAGADLHIQGNWYANIDIKHIFLDVRAKVNGGAIKANVSLDPTIVGFGVGYKF